MGLASLLPTSPRAVWSRVRAAMCCAFPTGFARPRRLSHAFLEAERLQLRQFRTDARSMLRGRPLNEAIDSTTAEVLPNEWWARYRCPPPSLPHSGTRVLVRSKGAFRDAFFVSLDADDRVNVRFDSVERSVPDVDVMLLAEVEPSPSPFLLSPLPALTSPAGYLLSPARPLSTKQFELELDVGQLAVARRLLDRKEDLLLELKSINDRVESTGSVPTDADKERYRAIRAELDAITADVALPRIPPSTPASVLQFQGHMRGSASVDRHMPFLARSGLITPSPRGSGKTRRRTPLPNPVGLQPLPALMPEHLAKNVDFRNAYGAALLAKALTRAALAKLAPDSRLKTAPTHVRADVMECVSSCVAVLVRARATRDFRCIDEVVEDIRIRFPTNSEALEAIHEAARTFDSSSSESSR